MLRKFVLYFTLVTAATGMGCTKRLPKVDMSQMDSRILERCTQGPGAMVFLDERYDDYWGHGYDPTSYLLLGEEGGGGITSAPTKRMTVRRRVLKILSDEGAANASNFTVRHYRENTPPVEVNMWMADGTPKRVNVQPIKTAQLVDWPCENGFPRETTFRIGPLAPGDIVEIIQPLCGPDQLIWRFGSPRFCVHRSRAKFGHEDDEYRPDMDATVFDASGGVKLVSPPGEHPMVFELQKTLMPISHDRIPFIMFSPRCPGWKHLRGRIFLTALWMARAGDITGRNKVNPFLVTEIEEGEKARRIRAVADWMNRRIGVLPQPQVYWMRWMPTEPAHKTAHKRNGTPGSWSVLAFRILEDAGLKPRFALVHNHPRVPLKLKSPISYQMDLLVVAVDDDEGKTHWLVPGVTYNPNEQPPAALKNRKALVLKRWWLDREQGAGRCSPELELTFSCQVSTPEPVEVELVTVGYEEPDSISGGTHLH